ncbi:Hsp70 family protein [Acidiphilium sp.]|uniref:Hsp70 family protein n=1 Tax=Acidiphilium sp. TaxID=527 RepID=UPI002586DC9D|nr:Hsp70 family protein [Acidiphilium sp.]
MNTIGIDFGTSNSCAAVWTPSGVRPVELANGQDVLPSVVAFTPGGVLTGRGALRQIHDNPAHTFRYVKRFLGKDFSEEEHGSWQMARGPDGKIWWIGPDGLISGPQIVAEILKTLLVAAEAQLGEAPTNAVITVPAAFHEPQKAAMREAAALAGLPNAELYEEPVAAALAFGIDLEKFARILVYDWGGGTFDVAIIHAGKHAVADKAHGGRADVGGADIDQLIVQHCDRILAASGHDVGAKPWPKLRLDQAAEEAKKALSADEETELYIDNFLYTGEGIKSFKEKLTRAQLEELAARLVKDTIDETKATLERAGLKRNQIHHILLVGGQTRMPLVHKAIEATFGKKPMAGVRPEFAVAHGAAIRGAELDGRIETATLRRIASASVGIRRDNGAFVSLIPKGAALPAERAFEVTTMAAAQEACSIQLYEGEHGRAAFNSLVADHAEPVTPGPQGEATVSAVVRRDEAGRLSLSVGGKQVYPGEDAHG